MECESLGEAPHGMYKCKKEIEKKWSAVWLGGYLFAASIAYIEQVTGMQTSPPVFCAIRPLDERFGLIIDPMALVLDIPQAVFSSA